MNFSTTLLLILAFIAANLPFLVERIFFFISPRNVNLPIVWMLFSFKGRLPRTPYWIFTVTVLIPLSLLAWAFLDFWTTAGASISFLKVVLALVTLIFSWIFFALQVKRLHDQDFSGKWSLLYLIPGALVLALINGLFAGKNEENRFGLLKARTSEVVHKKFFWRLLELVYLFFIVGGIALLLEGRLGDIHKQKWEFYAVNAALFVVFAYPGFVYRYLWRHRGA